MTDGEILDELEQWVTNERNRQNLLYAETFLPRCYGAADALRDTLYLLRELRAKGDL